ncbi:MAG: nitrite reductase (NAD(P)H) small subunit [Stellaceae bacterium]
MPRRSWIAVGRLDEIPRRGARRIGQPGSAPPIAVFRTGEDRVFALLDRCPHRGGPLSDGIVQGCAVACPLHGWVIDLASGKAEAPDEGCAPTLAIRLSRGRIWLRASDLARASRPARTAHPPIAEGQRCDG